MSNLTSRDCIIRAATLAREKLLAQIDADPNDPLVIHMQIIIEHAEAIIEENERRTT